MTEPANKKPAATMLILFWLVLFALLIWGFNDYLQGQTEPTIRDGQNYREVALTRSQGSHYIARGSINGQEVTFIVDTGATLVALSRSLAEQLQLDVTGRGQARTAGGIIPVSYSRLNSVRLGNIEVKNVAASISDDNHGIDEVLLGMSFLKDLELIQKDGQLLIRQY
jgi:aspartyl protease family protein